MAPSWSVYLLPVCLGVTSVKQTDWEHICTPHSSTEANPGAEEQAGLFSAPCLSAKFPALLETCGRALLWQGWRERTGRVGKYSASSSCLQKLAADCRRGEPDWTQLHTSEGLREILNLALCGSALLPSYAWTHGAANSSPLDNPQMLHEGLSQRRELPPKSFPTPGMNPRSPGFLSGPSRMHSNTWALNLWGSFENPSASVLRMSGFPLTSAPCIRCCQSFSPFWLCSQLKDRQ